MKNRQAYYILDPETDTKQEGDECWNDEKFKWEPVSLDSSLYRVVPYRRLIPDAPTPDDGWITWGGGECPVPGDTLVEVRFGSNDIQGGVTHARQYRWAHEQHMNIIAYRVVKALEPQWLPLGPDDVPPGSVFKQPHFDSGVFISNLAQNSEGITTANNDQELMLVTWETLMSLYLIKRPGEDWKPCKKLKL